MSRSEFSLKRIFRVVVYCSVIKVLCVCVVISDSYIRIAPLFLFVNTFFNFFRLFFKVFFEAFKPSKKYKYAVSSLYYGSPNQAASFLNKNHRPQSF